MKQFHAQFIDDVVSRDLGQAALFNLTETQYIDNQLWLNNDYRPNVSFNMAYTSNAILLKYTVKEKNIKAIYRQINDPVYKDSCVELFIAFNNESHYYNLEFNCMGTALVEYGAGKQGRVTINKQLIKKIESHNSIKTSTVNNGLIEWELTLKIPFTVFEYHTITSLKNQVCSVNFYKCGDELPEPHYLSWNNLVSLNPDFHLPEFFGHVKFTS